MAAMWRFVALISMVGLCLAADVTGKWSAEFDTQIGVQKYTYELAATGGKLTGKAISEHGETAITEGKVDGESVFFVENLKFNDMEIRVEYSGKIAGDEIKFTRKVGDFATEELVAKRVK
ncbi:MAG TPA: hypothetical protein VEQ63_16445 [Bryobacteraceae bacterium]|nr:hypothetical protein [Bryobacteraceae bacterium]